MVIEIEKGKNYAARFYYTDVFGHRKRPYKSGFPTRKAAELWEIQEKARLEGESVSPEGMTFGRLFSEWRTSLVKQGASPKTIERYDFYYRSKLAEYLDDLPLKKMNERVCQKIIDMHLASPSTCIELRKIMSAACNYARKKRWMRENPTEFIDLPKYRPKKAPAYNFDDIRTLFSAMRKANSKLYTTTLCVCFFAATREEVCALQETDISLEKNGKYRVSLDKAMITIRGRSTIKTQKTENRQRDFIFPKEIFRELHAFKDANGIVSPFVCCNKNGSNIQPNTLSNAFSSFLSERGLKYTTFHKLRDAFANSCKRLGVDLDTAFRMMGHSSYKVTAEHYATADDELIGDAVERITNALFGV